MNVQKSIRQLYAKLAEKYAEIDQIKAQVIILQGKCSHPSDRRVVVTDQTDLRDYTSCDDCGKVF